MILLLRLTYCIIELYFIEQNLKMSEMWINPPRFSEEYSKGVKDFVGNAMVHLFVGNMLVLLFVSISTII